MAFEKKIIQKYAELHNNRQIAHNNFLKTLITVGTGFLALFIGLKSNEINSEIAKSFFLLTIVLLVLGIIFTTISMYLEIYYINDNQTFLKKILKEYLDSGIARDHINTTKKPWFFKLFEFIGFGGFLLAPVSLIIYIYLVEFPH